MRAIHQDPRFSNCVFVPLVENNINKSFVNDMYAAIMREFEGRDEHGKRAVFRYTSDPSANSVFYGCWQTQHTKEVAAQQVERMLAMAQLSFAADMVVTNPCGADHFVHELTEQMLSMKRVYKDIGPDEQSFAKNTSSISGKEGGAKDDIVLAFLTGVHWSALLANDKRFIDFLRANDIQPSILMGQV